MNKLIIIITIILGVGISSCKKENSSDLGKAKSNRNLISIVEIPTADLSRAINFYQALLGITIEKINMEGNQMGIFPNSENTINVVLVKGPDYIPSKNGTVVYLDGGNDLQIILDKVEKNGGKIILPKTLISPEMGFFAMFFDSEGNKVGLHSKK